MLYVFTQVQFVVAIVAECVVGAVSAVLVQTASE